MDAQWTLGAMSRMGAAGQASPHCVLDPQYDLAQDSHLLSEQVGERTKGAQVHTPRPSPASQGSCWRQALTGKVGKRPQGHQPSPEGHIQTAITTAWGEGGRMSVCD